MAYRIEFLAGARRDADRLLSRISAAAPTQGPVWFRALFSAIETLEFQPKRCPLVARTSRAEGAVRQLLFGGYVPRGTFLGHGEGMRERWLDAAMGWAGFEVMENELPSFGSVPDCPGAWATGGTAAPLGDFGFSGEGVRGGDQ